MSTPAIQITRVTKNYRGLRPLRVAAFVLAPGERVAISGLDVAAAEALVDLVTGATLPDEGEIRVFGRGTADITTDTEWLAWLDQFGIVTNRAVLLDALTVQQNLAVPFTLDIEPVAPEIAERVEQLAEEVGLTPDLLDRRLATIAPDDRMRIHLARAVALDPAALLLEHPTALMPRTTVAVFAGDVRRVAVARRVAVLAMTEDREFADAVAERLLVWRAATGELRARRGWLR